MDERLLPPSAVVLDAVLKWSDVIGKAGTAKVVDGILMMFVRNHRGDYVALHVPVNLEGDATKDPPRFVLYRLGPGVWKLAPSVLSPQLHAYVTLVDVPEPAPYLQHAVDGQGTA